MSVSGRRPRRNPAAVVWTGMAPGACHPDDTQQSQISSPAAARASPPASVEVL